jgi:glutamate synthase (NADPH/NADH) small chain
LAGDILAAGKLLFENNPLSVVCALVCPHEQQCEGHCILGKKGAPIQFSTIEHYISSYYLQTLISTPPVQPEPCHRVAIVGSGPAGITIAILLAHKGYQITMFEANDKIGGVMRYGIPEFRLPKSILDKLKQKLISLGVKIRPNTLIGPNLTLEELFE